jgi:N6-adenosine-specific RNA methylase IME4
MSELASITRPWADQITEIWHRTRDGFFEMGRKLIEAKIALPHGAFLRMIESELPFGPDTAQRFMAIASDPKLTNAASVRHLPSSYSTLNELRKLDDRNFARAIERGDINPDMGRSAAMRLVQIQRLEQSAPATVPNPGSGIDPWKAGRRYHTILADPAWKFETWGGETGMNRSVDNHYRTMSLDEIYALKVNEIAADDSVLLLWATWPLLQAALRAIDAWKFVYKTDAFLWVKVKSTAEMAVLSKDDLHVGMGYWTRANTEYCLLATRGHPQRLNADVPQVIIAPVREHSRKPDEVYERIERLLPGPYVELFARQQRPGWDAWGNEVGKFDSGRDTQE